jgi:hypothetical protein
MANQIQNLDYWIQRTIPQVYDDSMSFYELLGKVVEKVNEVVKETNGFLSVDFTQYTEGVLQNWYDDGTLAEIINTDVLNMKVDTDTFNAFKDDSNEYLLYSFFKSNTDTGTQFFTSTDGEHLKKINAGNLNLANLRDPSICYFDGWFLVAYTGYNPADFKISRSKDFVNWETFDISLSLYQDTNSRIWAPDFFIDNDKLYVLVSNREGADNVDKHGVTVFNFKPYIAECLDVETLTFAAPMLLPLEVKSKIDATMIKHNGEYWIFIKDEIDKFIESWKSTTLLGQYTKISDNITGLADTEGPSITKKGNTFYLYADNFSGDNGITYFVTSTNLTTWSGRKQLKAKERLRHGTVFNVSDPQAINVLRKFQDSQVVSSPVTREKGITLSSLATNSVISTLELHEEMIYSVSGSEQIQINAISNPFNIKRFYLYIASNSDASIEIVSGSGVVSVPANTIYSASYGEGDTMIEFIYVPAIGAFKPLLPNAKKFYDKKVVPNQLGWKTTVLTTGTHTTLTIENGVIYRVNGGNDVIINNVSALPDGSKIGFMLAAGGAGSITINSGTNITVKGGTLAITVAAGNNDQVIQFVKVNGSTFRQVI